MPEMVKWPQNFTRVKAQIWESHIFFKRWKLITCGRNVCKHPEHPVMGSDLFDISWGFKLGTEHQARGKSSEKCFVNSSRLHLLCFCVLSDQMSDPKVYSTWNDMKPRQSAKSDISEDELIECLPFLLYKWRDFDQSNLNMLAAFSWLMSIGWWIQPLIIQYLCYFENHRFVRKSGLRIVTDWCFESLGM